MSEQGVKPSLPKNWFIRRGVGPILTTAVHAGHQIRDELKPYLEADDTIYRREEDPLTDILAGTGDHIFCCYNSRFEVDLNRSRELALATNPDKTWGLRIWKSQPPKDIVERSLQQHDAFYNLMKNWLEELIAQHRNVLVLDLHSYNHRRAGPNASPAAAELNPDVDLGVTTLNHNRFKSVVDALTTGLKSTACQGKTLDVRANVRYPDGGYWPEWVFAHYPDNICTVTLEYKKFYMDEWTSQADLAMVDDLRSNLSNAIQVAREALIQCN